MGRSLPFPGCVPWGFPREIVLQNVDHPFNETMIFRHQSRTRKRASFLLLEEGRRWLEASVSEHAFHATEPCPCCAASSFCSFHLSQSHVSECSCRMDPRISDQLQHLGLFLLRPLVYSGKARHPQAAPRKTRCDAEAHDVARRPMEFSSCSRRHGAPCPYPVSPFPGRVPLQRFTMIAISMWDPLCCSTTSGRTPGHQCMCAGPGTASATSAASVCPPRGVRQHSLGRASDLPSTAPA